MASIEGCPHVFMRGFTSLQNLARSMIQPPLPNNFEPYIPLFVTAVSPYDPDSRFKISSLTRLEAAGIKVVTALEHNLESIETFTWAELLEFISSELNLKELGQQIEAYLTGKTSYVSGAVLGFVF